MFVSTRGHRVSRLEGNKTARFSVESRDRQGVGFPRVSRPPLSSEVSIIMVDPNAHSQIDHG
jgi:hypothetical protein